MDNYQKHIERLHVYVLALVVAVFIVFLLFVSQTQFFQQLTTPQQPQKVEEKKTGSLVLQKADNQRTSPLGKNLVLQVVADSQNEDVVAFDTLLAYDADTFDFVSATSLNPAFQVSVHKNEGYVSVTAYQPPENNARSVMKDTPALQFVFIPKEKGSYVFSILEQSGKEKTQFADTKTTRLYPETSELTVEIN